MRFEFENLGPIDGGSVELNDLTVICGPNNTGKTYVSNCIYGLIKKFRNYSDQFISEKDVEELVLTGKFLIDLSDRINSNEENVFRVSQSFYQELPSFFSASQDFFKNTSVRVDENISENILTAKLTYEFYISDNEQMLIEKEPGSSSIEIIYRNVSGDVMPSGFLQMLINKSISESFYEDLMPEPFIVTTERTGIAMFYKELDEKRSEIFNIASSKTSSIKNFWSRVKKSSRYSVPIQDNMSSIRSAGDYYKISSFLSDDKYSSIFECISEIIAGKFSVENDILEYYPAAEEGRESVAIPFNLTSSSVKSMFLIDLYVRHLAEEGATLVIDEPELNLHPKNQRKMAELVAKLVNSGIKVVVTTHSDYFIRELNNRIMLSGDFSNKETIMKQYGLTEFDMIHKDKVKAYSLNNHVISESLVDDFGMNLELFDDVINESNELFDTLYFAIEEYVNDI